MGRCFATPLGTTLLLAACVFDPSGIRPRESIVPDGVDSPPRPEVAAADLAPSDRSVELLADSWTADLARTDVAGTDLARTDLARTDLPAPDLPQIANLIIYDDALANDWDDWSWWTTVNLGGSSLVKVGAKAANVTFYAGWAGFSLRKGTAVSTSGYSALRFWVHGGTGTNKSLRIFTQTADSSGTSLETAVSAVAGTWTDITVPLSSLGNPPSIKRLNFHNNSPSSQPMMTFDHIRLQP